MSPRTRLLLLLLLPFDDVGEVLDDVPLCDTLIVALARFDE